MATEREPIGFFEQAAGVIASAARAVMADGTIAAAGRMGIDELGAALKAFPDAIQVSEIGSIWSPTQGEVAAARADDTPQLPSPSEIAAETRLYQQPPDLGMGLDHGNDR
jgi:hypothetical protein